MYICSMRFSEIPGLEALKQKLVQNAGSGRIPHAQLFLGPEGSASLAMALAYASFILCENPGEQDSCGKCPACNKADKQIHPDLHFSYPIAGSDRGLSTEFLPAWREMLSDHPYFTVFEWMQKLEVENKQLNIAVHECRDIIRKLSLKSFEGPYKILIMWLPEYLGKEGNTLLKLIEEPPENTLFFLVARQQEQIISTILSRTQIIKVPRFSDEELIAYLTRQPEVSTEQARSVAFLADGNISQALHLLGDEENGYFNSFRIWLLACYGRKINEMIKWSDENAKLGRENLKHLLDYGVSLLREVSLSLAGAEELVKVQNQELEFVHNFRKICRQDMLEKMLKELNTSAYYIERNANPRIVLFNLSLRIKNIMASSRAN